MDGKAFFSVPFTKVTKNEDGTLFVFGKATGPDLDLDDQIIDQDFAKKAVSQWFESFGNVRQMHSTSLAPAGKAVELESREDGEYIRAKVVEPGAIKLVEEDVYSAFSIGISRPRIVRDEAAKNGRIIDGVVTEVSLVDYPANPTCKFALTKAASLAVEDGVTKAEDWQDIGEHELIDDEHKAVIEKSEAEPEVEVLDTEAAPLPASDPDPDPDPDPETEAEPESEDVDPEVDTEAEPEVEPEADDEPEVEVVVEADPEAVEPEEAQLPAAAAAVETTKVPELIKRVTEATVEKAGAGQAALAAVHSLLVEEIAEDGGSGSECYEIAWLSDLYTSLVVWVENDEWEDAWEELFAELAATPDAVKTKTLLEEIVARRSVEKIDLSGEIAPEVLEAAVAKAVEAATAPLNAEISKLTAQVDELGAQPDPTKAPFRGGTGGTVPVDVEDAGDEVVHKAQKGVADLSEDQASFRKYLQTMTKHSVPATAMKAREELVSFDAKHGIA